MHYMLKDSPQPQVPFILGLLNTNSAESLFSTKSISVPEKRKHYKIKCYNVCCNECLLHTGEGFGM